MSASSATLKIGESQTHTASVTGTGNTAVDWSVAGVGCSGAACGSISASGVYAAPSIVPQPPAVTITATSQADSSKFGSAALILGSDVALAVWPQAARIVLGGERHFLRMLTGSGNAAVTWSVGGACAGAACGTVTDGRCVAPASLPSNGVVTVTAASVVDPGKTAEATVTLGSGQIGQLVFHLVSPDRAVVMAAPDARVRAGMFERQRAAPYATPNPIGPGRHVLLLQRQPGSRCDEVVQVNHAEP